MSGGYHTFAGPPLGISATLDGRASRLFGRIATDPAQVCAGRGDLRAHPDENVGLQLLGILRDPLPVE